MESGQWKPVNLSKPMNINVESTIKSKKESQNDSYIRSYEIHNKSSVDSSVDKIEI
jgi:hypothetical protein